MKMAIPNVGDERYVRSFALTPVCAYGKGSKRYHVWLSMYYNQQAYQFNAEYQCYRWETVCSFTDDYFEGKEELLDD